MLIIFVLSTVMIFTACLICTWVGNKMYLAIKRDNIKFETEQKNKNKTTKQRKEQ